MLGTVCDMQERVHQKKSSGEDTSPSDPKSHTSATKSAEKLATDIDDLLDEIDEVLESNAEEFVKSYVQKGGQ